VIEPFEEKVQAKLIRSLGFFLRVRVQAVRVTGRGESTQSELLEMYFPSEPATYIQVVNALGGTPETLDEGVRVAKTLLGVSDSSPGDDAEDEDGGMEKVKKAARSVLDKPNLFRPRTWYSERIREFEEKFGEFSHVKDFGDMVVAVQKVEIPILDASIHVELVPPDRNPTPEELENFAVKSPAVDVFPRTGDFEDGFPFPRLQVRLERTEASIKAEGHEALTFEEFRSLVNRCDESEATQAWFAGVNVVANGVGGVLRNPVLGDAFFQLLSARVEFGAYAELVYVPAEDAQPLQRAPGEASHSSSRALPARGGWRIEPRAVNACVPMGRRFKRSLLIDGKGWAGTLAWVGSSLAGWAQNPVSSKAQSMLLCSLLSQFRGPLQVGSMVTLTSIRGVEPPEGCLGSNAGRGADACKLAGSHAVVVDVTPVPLTTVEAATEDGCWRKGDDECALKDDSATCCQSRREQLRPGRCPYSESLSRCVPESLHPNQDNVWKHRRKDQGDEIVAVAKLFGRGDELGREFRAHWPPTSRDAVQAALAFAIGDAELLDPMYAEKRGAWEGRGLYDGPSTFWIKRLGTPYVDESEIRVSEGNVQQTSILSTLLAELAEAQLAEVKQRRIDDDLRSGRTADRAPMPRLSARVALGSGDMATLLQRRPLLQRGLLGAKVSARFDMPTDRIVLALVRAASHDPALRRLLDGPKAPRDPCEIRVGDILRAVADQRAVELAEADYCKKIEESGEPTPPKFCTLPGGGRLVARLFGTEPHDLWDSHALQVREAIRAFADRMHAAADALGALLFENDSDIEWTASGEANCEHAKWSANLVRAKMKGTASCARMPLVDLVLGSGNQRLVFDSSDLEQALGREGEPFDQLQEGIVVRQRVADGMRWTLGVVRNPAYREGGPVSGRAEVMVRVHFGQFVRDEPVSFGGRIDEGARLVGERASGLTPIAVESFWDYSEPGGVHNRPLLPRCQMPGAVGGGEPYAEDEYTMEGQIDAGLDRLDVEGDLEPMLRMLEAAAMKLDGALFGQRVEDMKPGGALALHPEPVGLMRSWLKPLMRVMRDKRFMGRVQLQPGPEPEEEPEMESEPEPEPDVGTQPEPEVERLELEVESETRGTTSDDADHRGGEREQAPGFRFSRFGASLAFGAELNLPREVVLDEAWTALNLMTVAEVLEDVGKLEALKKAKAEGGSEVSES
jgi:hypothetical protein